MTWTSTDDGFATGGAFETANLTSCNQYTGGPVYLTNITMADRTGPLALNFTKVFGSNDTPSCGGDLVFTSSSVTMRTLNVDALVTGPGAVNTGESCYYTVEPHWGYGGYTYSWDVSGATITSGQGTGAIEVTFPSDGLYTVWATVTDAQGYRASRSMDVDAESPGERGCERT